MSELSRRTAIIGAAAVPLAACGRRPESPPVATSPSPGQNIIAVAEVPVGSGAIVDGTLVTQPTAGVFKGFVARCTHAGCALSKIVDGTITCPCHGSAFGLDGQVVRGPAETPLQVRTVSVRGGEIVATD